MIGFAVLLLSRQSFRAQIYIVAPLEEVSDAQNASRSIRLTTNLITTPSGRNMVVSRKGRPQIIPENPVDGIPQKSWGTRYHQTRRKVYPLMA
jgi:hypothetical protein